MAPGVVANQSEWSPFPAGPSRAAAVREGCHGDSPPGASAGPAGASGDGAESSTFHFTSREGWVRGRTSSWLSPAGSPVRAPRMEEEVTYADLQIPPPAATAGNEPHRLRPPWHLPHCGFLWGRAGGSERPGRKLQDVWGWGHGSLREQTHGLS